MQQKLVHEPEETVRGAPITEFFIVYGETTRSKQAFIPQKPRRHELKELHCGRSEGSWIEFFAKEHVWWSHVEEIREITSVCTSHVQCTANLFGQKDYPDPSRRRIYIVVSFEEKMLLIAVTRP